MMKMPLVALRGMTILPHMNVRIDINGTRPVQTVEHAMLKNKQLFVVAQRDEKLTDPALEDLYRYGTICTVKQIIKLPNKIVRVVAEGKERGELLDMQEQDDCLYGDVEEAPFISQEQDAAMEEAMKRQLQNLLLRYAHFEPKKMKDLAGGLNMQQSLQSYEDELAARFPAAFEDKQQYLEANSTEERYEVLSQILQKEIQVLGFQKDLRDKVQERVDKRQKEYLLREQQKMIQEELDKEEDFSPRDAKQFTEEAKNLNASQEVKEHLLREISQFQTMAPGSGESTVLRNYIELLLEMPWDNKSEDNADIKTAKQILEEDHYGLEKVKRRVLEFLAVRSLLEKKGSSEADAPIICLVGPPGTGKTSIAKSVARALNKKYVRISLGGVRDEAEIRGHRRTYIGAMPGRIAAGLKQAGVKNPLMLLDEIDKVSSDYKGDTASALLEVLDGEQNCKFRDHYIEVPLDLSEVLFIATANTTQTIPRPLLDRMEVIELNSYTANEKFHIATQYLIPKQIAKNGLDQSQLSIQEPALKEVIASYTREAGVRELERKIGELCRKCAVQFVEEEAQGGIEITPQNLSEYLGKPHYHVDAANKKDEIGIVCGLAWTSVGGATLQVEVNVMPGKGEILLTGQLGEVMQESARAGISFIRSVADRYQIPEDYFQKHDIHIHIPEGAVPKDGPSAGITMATAILSAVTGRPVRHDVAMTGEITLRGRVLPIGGLKEKTLAAKSAGIRTVIVPEENKADVLEFEEEITDGLEFVYVTDMEQVVKRAVADEYIE